MSLSITMLILICFLLVTVCSLGTDHIDITEKATLGGGCFWCMQPLFDTIDGVLKTEVGYMGGKTLDPTYEDICSGESGHAEVIQITFDPNKVSYEFILSIYWRNINPTTLNQQFVDRGSQYRSVIFYHSQSQKEIAESSKIKMSQSRKFKDPIVTEITGASTFFPAEDYHQSYYLKNPLHYQFYKTGSGREHFLKRIWTDKKK